MQKINTPIRLWNYVYEYTGQIRSLTITNQFLLKNRTLFEHVKGYTLDISEFATFKWYDWCWYYDEIDMQKKHIARWLGPVHNSGQGLSNYVLTTTREVLMRSIMIPFSEEDNIDATINDMKKYFKEKIKSTIGNYTTSIINETELNTNNI